MVFIRLNKSTCESSLVHHRRYKTIISAKNDLGTTNSTGEILFSKSNYYAYNYQGQCGKALSISVLFKRCIFCGFPQKLCSANNYETHAKCAHTASVLKHILGCVVFMKLHPQEVFASNAETMLTEDAVLK